MANPPKGEALLSDASGDPLLADAQTLIADLTMTFTTDDPGQSAADTVVIADGDATVAVAEFTQAILNLNTKINAILDVLEAHGLMKDA